MAPRSAKTIAETDLYRPVHDFLVAQGYSVRSEVRNCDITATRGDELIVIELKKTFGTALLVQAAQRQRITDSVYVALPRAVSRNGRDRWRGIRHLLRRLEVGLILVSVRSRKPSVEVVFHPLPFERRKRRSLKAAVLRETAGRSEDFNVGGSTRRKIVTAYRENAIQIACLLEKLGPLSPRQLRELGTGPKTQSILSSDFYGWFERIARGVYALKRRGQAELGEYPEVAARYRTAEDGAAGV